MNKSIYIHANVLNCCLVAFCKYNYYSCKKWPNNNLKHLHVYMWPDLTKAGFGAHIRHVHFSPPIDSFIHELTVDGYCTVHSSSVCFSHALFLWRVWCPRVHECSLNGPGAGWQVANWLKTSSKVDIDVRNWIGSILWGLQLKMTLGMAYWAIHVADKIFVKLYPTLLPYVGTFVIWTIPV